MATQKFLLIYRTPSDKGSDAQPSPEEMQAVYAQWNAWKAKFKNNIVDLGDGLKPGGRILKGGLVTDGPYVESKEVVGGYSMVAAESYEQALAVARECPILFMTGSSIEIRELAGH